MPLRIMSISSGQRIQGLTRLVRPKQWIKNAFVFAPLVFARQFSDWDKILDSLFAFAVFCLAASACYIINDLRDVQHDRQHPTKRLTRPLASGSISSRDAVIVLGVILGALLVSLAANSKLAPVVGSYILLNVAYTYVLKDQPVVDIFSIAIGFVLRVYAGAVALGVPLSDWMLVTTLCLALYLASIKRRQELISSGAESRVILAKYSPILVDRFAEMAATGALIFYSLFVMSTNHRLIATIPLVIFGLFRYWYVVDQEGSGESPTDVVLYDWPLLSAIVAWGAICLWVLSSS
ncbi:MAG: decaprenyl-phosphate phosphoribosyltransferase [Reyranella sp.]|nr:MAG: decaprenyl-phosphate phosphoribosyltransferase [Reyranella sp.]